MGWRNGHPANPPVKDRPRAILCRHHGEAEQVVEGCPTTRWGQRLATPCTAFADRVPIVIQLGIVNQD